MALNALQPASKTLFYKLFAILGFPGLTEMHSQRSTSKYKRTTLSLIARLAPCLALSIFALSTHASTGASKPDKRALSPRGVQCVNEAAMYHKVNPNVLAAIARVESLGNSKTVTRNTNNSIDVGLVGTNSIHFQDLAKKGVGPSDLLDECVSLYVGAWMYSKKIHKYGNTWKAIGAYHSKTPRLNYRYQVLVYNELIRMGINPNVQ